MKDIDLDLQRFAEGDGGPAGESSAGEANAGTEEEGTRVILRDSGNMQASNREAALGESQSEAEGSRVPKEEAEVASPRGEAVEQSETDEVEEELEPENDTSSTASGPPSPQGEGQDTPSIEDRLAALEEALQKQNELLLRREQDIAMRQHFTALEQQGEAMKEQFPAFDLKAELADPLFVKLTSPMVGLSVEDAYYALHHDQITAAGAQAAAELLGNSVKAGKAMPMENGGVQRGTPEGFKPLAELSPEERKFRMDLIRSGKLRFD